MRNNKLNECIEKEKKKDYFLKLSNFIDEERRSKIIYPSDKDVFSCFEHMNTDIKVVIIGQDPYHNPNEANGLAFSVSKEVKIPRSLQNIYKELSSDIHDFQIPLHGDLTHWSNQGVLLLNTSLTVIKNSPASHSGIGWEIFTDKIVDFLNTNYSDLVFILWGKHAQEKGKKIDKNKHYVIESFHPSPFSARRGFFGSKPFSKTNDFLLSKNITPIDWHIK